MESLNSIKQTIDVSLPVFAPISINLYLQVIAFHSLQNNAVLFQAHLCSTRTDTSLTITVRVLLLFMTSTAGVKSGTIDWQSAHLTVLLLSLAFQSSLPIMWNLRCQCSDGDLILCRVLSETHGWTWLVKLKPTFLFLFSAFTLA